MTNETDDITLQLDSVQSGEIKVHSQIINDLSSGIYSSPASCIKELINNSYDADASLVTIRMKPVEDTITIMDDGDGMNAIDFSENFAWISKSNKRNLGSVSQKGRPLIGKIGIGFIAVNEICDTLEVISTKKNEKFKFTATIDLKDYQNKNVEKKDNEGNIIGYIKGAYTLINEEEDESEHYTIIRLVSLKETVVSIFRDEVYKTQIAKTKNKSFGKSLFKNMKELLEFHSNKNLHSFGEDSQYVQFILDLASYIPIEYIDEGPIPTYHDKVIDEIVNFHKQLNFKVDLDGIYLRKPIYFPTEKNKHFKVKSFKKEIEITKTDKIKFRGYFYTQNKLLIPRELNGVSIRIKNIPIAEKFGFDTTFLDYPNYTDQIFRNWISGELYIEEGLEEAMNIDRQSFRVTHPHYLALQSFVHKFLREEFFSTVVQQIFEEGSKRRQTKKKAEKSNERKKLLNTLAVKVEFKAPSKKGDGENFVVKKSTNKETVVEVDKNFMNQFTKKDWEFLEDIFLIFELSLKEAKSDINSLKSIFYNKVVDWKSKK
ncbi:MAG TPA: ATP-binding protein [Segetibacter sp.]|jgi:hypothetical protein